MIKRIIVNVILALVLLLSIEAFCFYKTKQENEKFKQSAGRLKFSDASQYKTKYKILEDFKPVIFRKSSIIDNAEKKPVLLFGCSFAEGAGLTDNNTPCSRISKLTGRSCINRAKGAMSAQFMYYQLLNENFYKEFPEADYIIYIYIYNHLQRLYNYQINPLLDMFNLRYKIDDGNLKEIKPFFKPFYSSYAVKRLLNTKVSSLAQTEEKDFKLFNKIMLESVKLIKAHYPDAEIIMLEYPEPVSLSIPDYEREKLENMGVKLVKVLDLTQDIDIYDKKYWLEDNIHPGNAAWDVIMPRFVHKYLN